MSTGISDTLGEPSTSDSGYNAEWANWIDESAAQMEQRGNKSSFAFRKAASALKKHSAPLHHPSDARKLPGVGASSIKIIVQKMRQKYGDDIFSENMPAEAPRHTRKRTMSGDAGQPKRQRKYIPKRNSPAYAALMALYDLRTFEVNEEYAVRTTISTAATKYLNKPSSVLGSQKGQTNAISVSVLVRLMEYSLVALLDGRPQKWALTQDGVALVEKMLSVDEGSPTSSPEPPDFMQHFGVAPPEDSDPASFGHVPNMSSMDVVPSPVQSNSSITVPPGVFWFSYVDENNNRVPDRASAEVSQDPVTLDTLYLIEYHESLDTHVLARGLKNKYSPRPQFLHAFMKHRVAPDISPGLTPRPPSLDNLNAPKDIESPIETPLDTGSLSQGGLDPSPRGAVLAPGEFEIVLLIDSREVAPSRRDRAQVAQMLQDKGLCVERVSLPVGDVMWAARRKGLTSADYRGYVVLNTVLERKRLDDLVESIKDGRLSSQRARLRKSKLPHTGFIIESFPNADTHSAAWAKQINTAKSSLVVMDNFSVFESSGHQDTLAFLENMTSIIIAQFANRPIHIVADKDIDHGNLPDFHSRFMSFSVFNELNSFASEQTYGHVWASQIQRIRGVSPGKAWFILKRWPSLSSLMSSLSSPDRALTLPAEPSRKKKSVSPLVQYVTNELECVSDDSENHHWASVAQHIVDLFLADDYSVLKG